MDTQEQAVVNVTNRHQLTASKVGLAQKCSGFLYQPWQESISGEAATFGTKVHLAMENYLKVGDYLTEEPKVLARAEQLANWWESWKIGKHITKVLIEAAYSYNSLTGHVAFLGECLGRNYPKDVNLICGSADVVVEWQDENFYDTTTVIDWKTGQFHDGYYEQMQFLMACAQNIGLPESILVFADGERDVYSIVYESEVEQESYRFSEKYVPGEHCRSMWCPARHSCPVSKSVVDREKCISITNAETAEAWRNVRKMAEDEIKARDNELKALVKASGGELKLPNGNVLRYASKTKTSWDGDALDAFFTACGSDTKDFRKITEYEEMREIKPKKEK